MTIRNQRFSFLKQPISSTLNRHFVSYLTPSNLSYWWGSGICLVIHIMTLVFLAMHHTPHVVEHIMCVSNPQELIHSPDLILSMDTAQGVDQAGTSHIPPPDSDTLFWEERVEKTIRLYLKEAKLHIPRPHTIRELREAVCGKNAGNFGHGVFLQNFHKVEKYKIEIGEVISKWRNP